MRIISTAICPEGDIRGYDGDERRANLLENGDILCVTCGKVHDGTPESQARARQILGTSDTTDTANRGGN